MKKHIKGFVAGVLVMALLSVTLIFASPAVVREIYYGIGVVLNGHVVQFDEDSQPFIMDGRTFLPLRAMAEMLGLPVGFDAEQNTVHVGYAVHPVVGTWREYVHVDEWIWRVQFEFFADGTGDFVDFNISTGESSHEAYFMWDINAGTIIFEEHPWEDRGDIEYDLRFAFFQDVLHYGELMLATLIIDGEARDFIVLERIED